MTDVLIRSRHPIQTIRAGINEPRLLAQMKHFFSTSHSAVGELMQNARRAGATAVHFEFDLASESLTVTDDGCGIEDFEVLVRLCASGWDEQTTLTERPFGMGLFSLLFAAGEIAVRSRGLRMVVTLADVVDKRPIPLLPDPEAPLRGTRIELRNLAPDFLGKWNLPMSQGLPAALPVYGLCTAINFRARGFAIRVWLNGVECPRPLAQDALPGVMTSIGFVSLRGVHRQRDESVGRVWSSDARSLFLQGLPVDTNTPNQPRAVVHLDAESFTPTMPDRTRLYDADAAHTRIRDVLCQLVRDHLVERKATLSGADFVLRHWQDCREYEMQHLLADIPFIPRNSIRVISEVTEDSADEYELDFTAGIDPARPGSDLLVSRDDILTGAVRIWRGVPGSPSETPQAALVLKVMQREDIGALWESLKPGHWIHSCTPDVEDLRFKVAPITARGHASYFGADWIAHCDLQLVDRVDVEVTSAVDPALSLKLSIKQDWVLLPVDHATGGLEESTLDGAKYRAVCFITAAPGGQDHPVNALSAFNDEDDHFHEEWRDRAFDLWDALVAGLRGKGLPQIVAAGLVSSSVCPSDCHLGDFAIVRADACGGGARPIFEVVDPQAPGFWVQVAQQLGTIQSEATDEVNALAARIEVAVRTAVMSAGTGCLAQAT